MPRLLGLAQASKIYKSVKLKVLKSFQEKEMKLLSEQLGMLLQQKVISGKH
jgi:hypothetical protein